MIEQTCVATIFKCPDQYIFISITYLDKIRGSEGQLKYGAVTSN